MPRRVSARMCGVPSPCTGDDLAQVPPLWIPTENFTRFFRARDQRRRISGTPRGDARSNFSAGYFLGDRDHFFDGVARTVAQIENAFNAAVERMHRIQMGLGQIDDVNVIADASAVRRGIVVAENLDFGSLPRGLEHTWDEMSFRLVILPALVGCTRGVEVSQRRVGEMFQARVPCQNTLEQ